MGTRALAAAAGVLGALLLAGEARAQEITLSRAGLSVTASADPAGHGRLPVHRRATVSLALPEAAGAVRAWLVRDGMRVGGRLEVEQMSERGWVIRLPGRLRRARALELAVDGATSWAGIRTAASCARSPAPLARLSQEPPPGQVPELRVKRAGVSVTAPLLFFCSGGFCGDAFRPHPAGRLPVLPGGGVVIESSDDVTRADASLLRHVKHDRYEPVGAPLSAERITARRWRVTLPVDLQGADVLIVSVAWSDGDYGGAAGLRLRCGR
jgi:hypothetical protein